MKTKTVIVKGEIITDTTLENGQNLQVEVFKVDGVNKLFITLDGERIVARAF